MRNGFVYDEINMFGLSAPDIEVLSQRYYSQCAEDIIVISILKALSMRGSFDFLQSDILRLAPIIPLPPVRRMLIATEN